MVILWYTQEFTEKKNLNVQNVCNSRQPYF